MRLALALVFALAALVVAAPAWADSSLVAAYSFDEGSGGMVNDASGNGHLGTISGATWSSGHSGGALSFNGSNASVDLGGLGRFYQTGFTLEAWVDKQSVAKNDVAVLGTWTGTESGGPMIWVDNVATRYQLTMNAGASSYLDSGQNPVAGQWQHLAATFDGSTARFYINGVEVANRAVTGSIGNSNSWRIGAYGSTPGGFFDGLIDDVRIYSRALSASEVQTDMNTPVGIAGGAAPTTPGNFVVTGNSKTSVAVQWDASTDDVGVSGYHVFVNGANVGTTTSTSFTFSNLTCSTSYQLGVEAFDADGNVSSRALRTASTDSCDPSTGLVAAYSFDEGAGGVTNDASGNGHTGTISGATWTTGHFGGALSFNGTSNSVDLGGLGTFYQSGFTEEAWVQKQSATKNDVGVVGTWSASNGGPMIWVDHIATRYHLTLGNSFGNYLDSGRNPVAGQWQYVAATYDGVTARFYIDGVEVANSTFTSGVGSSNNWKIGAYGPTAGGFFDGLIDNVRIYSRALTAGEVQADMTTPVTTFTPPPDTTAPSAPGTLTASTTPGTASLGWGAASDNVGVVRYDVYRGSAAGFVPSVGNRVGQPAGLSFVDSGLAAGSYFYKVAAEDAAGNVGPVSNEVSVSVSAPDTTPPSVSVTAPAAGSVSGPLTVTANASDNDQVAGVQFKLDGANLGSEDTSGPYQVAWDTRGELNGPHTLTAVARDASGNTTTSSPVNVTVSNLGVSTAGLKGAYAFDDGSGTTALDSSGNSNNATLSGASWSSGGEYGGSVSLDGTSNRVDLPALGTFYKTGFTLEAWVDKQSGKPDAGVVGSWDGGQAGGAMIWIDHLSGHYRLTLGNNLGNYLDSGVTPSIGHWQHVAATFDGLTARFYIDGTQVASTTYSGNVGNSNNWRIGAYGSSPGGFFDGQIDNVRIYSRALTATEIQTDMASRVQPDTTPPTVTTSTPADSATNVPVATKVTAKFSEPMLPSSLTTTSFVLKDAGGNTVPATVSYDQSTRTATLTPQTALQFATVYHAVVEGGGPQDLSGNAVAADVGWSFTTEARSPILLVTSTTNPFTVYLAEILRNEGLDDFTSVDISNVSPTLLSGFDVVLLGDMSLSAGQVSELTTWVNAGGNLIAMHPDKQLAGLLGLTDAGSTMSNAYLKVDTSASPGAGIVPMTIQYHGSADRYTLNGATAVATLYSDASTATSNPAVTLRTVGASGGQAASFTYDLARSVVYTRQGNPAWAGEDRDGFGSWRPNDLFYGAMTGDVQPDWVDTTKIAIPQADEQQRLLVNLITTMERDRLPLPHFWYLPRGLKAAVVMSGDDHAPDFAPGGTASNFDRFKALSPPGCVVALWQCVRSTSWIFPNNPLTNAQAASYIADGFEIALHPMVGSCPTTLLTQLQLSAVFDTQLAAFAASYPSIPAPTTSRTHCVYWPDWASEAKVELAHGIRLDGNYYHYPGPWIGDKPGFLNGGGFPMRFADTDGSIIDVYQENTNMTDESNQAFPATINALLDNALGPQGYYGTFGANIHTDNPAPLPDAEAIVASAQARGVPVISYKQLLTWVDGRDSSSIRNLSWNAGTLTFTTSVGTGADGLQTMLPVQGPGGSTLASISRGGSAVTYTVQTIKGIQYAMFDTVSGTYQATYS